MVGVLVRDHQHLGLQGISAQQRQQHTIARIAAAALAIARPRVIQQAVARRLNQHRIALAHIHKQGIKLTKSGTRRLITPGCCAQHQDQQPTAAPPKNCRLLLPQGQIQQHGSHRRRTQTPRQGRGVQHGVRPGRAPV